MNEQTSSNPISKITNVQLDKSEREANSQFTSQDGSRGRRTTIPANPTGNLLEQKRVNYSECFSRIKGSSPELTIRFSIDTGRTALKSVQRNLRERKRLGMESILSVSLLSHSHEETELTRSIRHRCRFPSLISVHSFALSLPVAFTSLSTLSIHTYKLIAAIASCTTTGKQKLKDINCLSRGIMKE